MDLDDKTYDAVVKLGDKANVCMDEKRYRQAIELFEGAFRLLPDPKTDWEAQVWLAASIGDAHYLEKRFDEAQNWFSEALKGPGGFGNAFIHLRLGQIARRRGDEDRAVDELLRAYMADGEDIFDGVPGDLRFLRSKVSL